MRHARIPDALRVELESCGLPYEVRPGSGHLKLLVAGRLAGVLPAKPSHAGGERGTLNLRAAVRRLVRSINA